MEHVKNLLSPFMDDQLPEAEKKMVEAHVERCADCRGELDGLRAVSRLLASAPDKPLPVGFQQRLENKRRAAEQGAEKKLGFLPAPAKPLAFAMSAAIVMLVIYDKAKNVAGPGPSAEADGIAFQALSEDRSAAPGRFRSNLGSIALDGAASSAAPEPALQEKGAEFGLGGVKASPSALARSARARRDEPAPGRPIGVKEEAPKPKYTNENLADFLVKERDKMGIQEIVTPGSVERQPPNQNLMPMSPQEARAYMRQMAQDVAVTRRMMQITPDGVPLGAGKKPKLLAKEQSAGGGGAGGGAPMDAMDGRIKDLKSDEADRMMVAASGQAMSFASAPAPQSAPAMKAVSAVRGSAPPASEASAPLKKRTILIDEDGAEQEVRPQREAKANAATSGAVAARSADELQDLWRRLGRSDAPPQVDFSKEMVVGVLLPRSPAGTRVEIVSVRSAGSRLIIDYREIPPSGVAGSAGLAYGFRVVGRSSLPVEARQTP